MAVNEPQSANDYDNRTTAAIKSVLIEIRQVLGSFEGQFAVIGGAVPWLLLNNSDMPHVGTGDVDLVLDAEALGDGEYVRLVEALQAQGYNQRQGLRKYQLVRTVPARDSGSAIDVIVEFLMPHDAGIVKNTPAYIDNFRVIPADGADLALKYNELIEIDGEMPDGRRNSVFITVASIPALLAMKGYAISGRDKLKDAYDIYYSIRNYPNGIESLIAATAPLLEIESARQGYNLISKKFRDVDDFGPTSVRKFIEGSDSLGRRTPVQWQQDAFGQVNAWILGLGLR